MSIYSTYIVDQEELGKLTHRLPTVLGSSRRPASPGEAIPVVGRDFLDVRKYFVNNGG